MNLEPEQVMALIAAHDCLLKALCQSHPDPMNLLRLYLERVEAMRDIFAQTQSPNFQAAFQSHATTAEKMIPA